VLNFPVIPGWDGLHPLVIHFPVALLMVTPIFILIGALSRRNGRTFLYAGWLLMLLGTAGAFLAAETGEAAAQLVERSPQVNAVLERHESLAEATRITFSVLSVVFGAILLGPRLVKREMGRAVSVLLPLAFLVFYGTGLLVLANTAHNGGRLVHQLGVAAALPAEAGSVSALAPHKSDD
jgi:uncharacterized membrane protein